MSDNDHRLFQTTRAADVLKEQLREIAGDDAEVVCDTLEGEFDLPGLICKAVSENASDGALVKAIRQLEDDLAARRDRVEKRVSHRKVAILAAMQTAEMKTLETPAGTVTRKAVPPSLLVLDEAAIPAEFWKAQEPKLDRKALAEAVKAGAVIPGAQMSNGGETIQTRT